MKQCQKEKKDTSKLIYEIKEKLDKVRGIEKVAQRHIPKPIQKPTINKKSKLSLTILVILIVVMGVIWTQFFSALSNPGMPTEEEINAHEKEFKLEVEKNK